MLPLLSAGPSKKRLSKLGRSTAEIKSSCSLQSGLGLMFFFCFRPFFKCFPLVVKQKHGVFFYEVHFQGLEKPLAASAPLPDRRPGAWSRRPCRSCDKRRGAEAKWTSLGKGL